MPAGFLVMDMVARMPFGAGVAGPAVLAATESVSEVVAAAAATGGGAVELHMKNDVPARHAGLEWGYSAEAAGTRRRAWGTRYSRVGRTCFGSTHMPAVGR
jgi:hypothetical protein